jgi:hypothetical protein
MYSLIYLRPVNFFEAHRAVEGEVDKCVSDKKGAFEHEKKDSCILTDCFFLLRSAFYKLLPEGNNDARNFKKCTKLASLSWIRIRYQDCALANPNKRARDADKNRKYIDQRCSYRLRKLKYCR